MRLLYCASEWLDEAIAFGKREFGESAIIREPIQKFHAPEYCARLAAGELSIRAFDGKIVDIDDETEEVFVMCEDARGHRDEFFQVGLPEFYRIGGHILIRIVDIPMASGKSAPCVFEVWVD